MAQRSSATQPAPANLAPLISAVAVVGAVVATFFQLPGAVIAAAGVALAGFFYNAPPPLNPKDPQPDIVQMQQRRWQEMRWRTLIPSGDWLLNDPADMPKFRDRGRAALDKLSAKLPAPIKPAAGLLGEVLGMLSWFIFPSRFVGLVALGAGLAAATIPANLVAIGDILPKEAIGYDLVWVNAIYAYGVVMASNAVIRRSSAVADPSPGVPFSSLTAKAKAGDGGVWRAFIGFGFLGLIVAAGCLLTILSLDAAYLFVPTWLFGVGLGMVVAGGCLHGVARKDALEAWRDKVAARAEWVPRWEAMKYPEVAMVNHERVGSFVVDTFDAPPSLGSAKAINLYNTVVPYLSGGGDMNVAMLTVPALDSQGQPIPGSAHATQFRVVVAPGDAEVQTLDPAVNVDELKLAAEVGAFHAARELNTQVPVLMDLQPSHTADSKTAVWQTMWTIPLASATTVALYLGVNPDTGIFSEGTSTFFGDFDGAALRDRSLPARMEKAAYIARWDLRWADALKQGEKAPVLQYPAIKRERLNQGTELVYEPFLTLQGISPMRYFGKEMREKLATTLRAAPFVTVVGLTGAIAASAGALGAGIRHPQGFAVVHSSTAIPNNPADIPAPGPRARDVAKWVLGGLINKAFEDAKLPYPEVIKAEALTRPQSRGHVWKVELRLYDGVTTATLKLNAVKLAMALGGVRWLRFEESDNGCFMVMGAAPHAEGVKFSNPRALAYCDKLDWAQAFQDSGVRSVTDGSSPLMVENDPHETNPKITRMVFTMPQGFNLGKVVEATQKLRAATANDYVEIRPAATPDKFIVLASEQNPIPFPATLDWDASMDVAGKGEHSIPFGYATDGSTVSLNWKNDFHMMVLGGSGSGKSSFIQVLVVGAILRGCDVFMMDPTKGATDFEFAAPWIRGFAREGQHLGAGELTQLIGMEMNERKRLNGQYGVGNYRDLPPEVRPRHMFVVVDEFQSLIKEVSKGALKQPDTTDEVELALFEQRKNINDGVRKLAMWIGKFGREARAVGITVVLAGQGIKAPELEAVNLQGLKDLTLDTLLPVPVSEKFPTGWARNDELGEGDLLYAADGSTTPIVTFSEVIEHDALYEVVFDDGHAVTTGPGHLWLASDAKGRQRAATCKETAASKEQHYRDIAASIPAGTLMDAATLGELYGASREDTLWRIQRFGLERAVRDGDSFRWLDRDETGYRMHVDAAEFFSRLADVYSSAPAERVVTTEEMAKTLHRSANGLFNWTVRLAGPIQSDDIDLPVDPYILGAWLGDGSKGSGIFSAGRGERSTDVHGLTDQQHLIDQLTSAGFDGHALRCSDVLVGTKGLKVKLRDAGVLNDKHIPAIYKRASVAQRLALLQGLMDTDGAVVPGGRMSFTQVNPRLAADFRELVESLGIKVTVHERANAAGNWTSQFKFRTNMPVFRLPRKLARFAPISENSISTRRRIVDIRKVAAAPTRCIAVAHAEKLFLVEGFIPTHNTNFSRVALGKMTHGDMASAFKDVSILPNLGSDVPQGRGIFEGTSGDPLVIQSWYEPGGQDEMRRRLAELVPVVPADRMIDVAALEERVASSAPRAFGAVMDEFEVEDEEDEQTIELSADELGLDLGDLSFGDFSFENAPSDEDDAFTLVEPPVGAPLPQPEVPAPAEEQVPAGPDSPLLFHEGQFVETPIGLSGCIVIGTDVVFGVSAPTGDGSVTGWPEGDALQNLLFANPDIDTVVWDDPMLDELDDIGIPREEIARDVCARFAVTLNTQAPAEPEPVPAAVEPEPEPEPVVRAAAPTPEPAPATAAIEMPVPFKDPTPALFEMDDFDEPQFERPAPAVPLASDAEDLFAPRKVNVPDGPGIDF